MRLDNTYLLSTCEPFDFSNPPFDPKKFAEEVSAFLEDIGALGVAANQLGLKHRVFALGAITNPFVCFNPEIIEIVDSKEILWKEGCLSYPDLYVDIKRPYSIRVKYQSYANVEIEQVLEGLTARAFIHELDHLDGKVFYNRANRFHREKAMKRWRSRQ